MEKLTTACLAASILVLTACAKSAVGSVSEDSLSANPIETPPPTGARPPADPAQAIPGFPQDGQTFNAPWTRTDTAIVIDAYEGNAIAWDQMAADKRVVAVIHRASSGLAKDSQYAARKLQAKARGYLWGAYHVGSSGDPIAQANLFLTLVNNEPDTLMFLDLEDTSDPKMMNIPNAVLFMNYVYAKTGKIPVVYANQSVTLALNIALKANSLFKLSRFWYARFKTDVTDFPAGIWSTYFLWQFSSEVNCTSTGHCLYNVPGTSFDMDINVFYGTKAALASQWN